MHEVPAAIIKKIQTLAQIAADFRQGKEFNITRLTMLKSPCSDSDAAARFALDIAKKTQQTMKRLGRSRSKRNESYRRLPGKAVSGMTAY